jgi:hypothetical protein
MELYHNINFVTNKNTKLKARFFCCGSSRLYVSRLNKLPPARIKIRKKEATKDRKAFLLSSYIVLLVMVYKSSRNYQCEYWLGSSATKKK